MTQQRACETIKVRKYIPTGWQKEAFFMKKNHLTTREKYALLDGLTEEQLNCILEFIDEMLEEDKDEKEDEEN